MKIKNETEIQLMKILFKTSGKKPTKNITSQRAYPHGAENKYFRQLKGFFKPLTDYVNKYVNENLEQLLRGDSTEIHLDTIPGQSFRDMIYNLENWLSIYMPDIADLPTDSNNNVIFTALGKTADEAKSFGDKEFQKIIEKGIHVSVPTSSPWWDDMKSSWAENNYTLITSNAKKYVEQINNLTEQAIVNGLSPKKLKEEIMKVTEGLSDKHCKLLARDQMGKLNGNITEAQMQEIGLDLYVWSTAFDDRVRDSHAATEGLLCRWDDASVCSYDGGKTWVDRPSGAVTLHPGQDIQCRCVGLAYYPELTAEIEGKSLEEVTEGLPPVQDLPEFQTGDMIQYFIKDGLATKTDEFKDYIINSFENTNYEYQKVMQKIVADNKKTVVYDPTDSNKTSYFVDDMKNKKLVIYKFEKDGRVLRHEMGHFWDNILGEDIKIQNALFANVKQPYRKAFSESDVFKNVYEKEGKEMIKKLKAAIKGFEKLSASEMTYRTKRFLYNMSKEEEYKQLVGPLADMFTAFEKKNYGGHTVKYFKEEKVIKQYPQLKDRLKYSEGFAELCELWFNKNLNPEAAKFLDFHFAETKKVLYNKLQEFTGGR